jgi:hypothetical protein
VPATDDRRPTTDDRRPTTDDTTNLRVDALRSSIIAKTFGALESLAQYEYKECGGATTTFGQGTTIVGPSVN